MEALHAKFQRTQAAGTGGVAPASASAGGAPTRASSQGQLKKEQEQQQQQQLARSKGVAVAEGRKESSTVVGGVDLPAASKEQKPKKLKGYYQHSAAELAADAGAKHLGGKSKQPVTTGKAGAKKRKRQEEGAAGLEGCTAAGQESGACQGEEGESKDERRAAKRALKEEKRRAKQALREAEAEAAAAAAQEAEGAEEEARRKKRRREEETAGQQAVPAASEEQGAVAEAEAGRGQCKAEKKAAKQARREVRRAARKAKREGEAAAAGTSQPSTQCVHAWAADRPGLGSQGSNRERKEGKTSKKTVQWADQAGQQPISAPYQHTKQGTASKGGMGAQQHVLDDPSAATSAQGKLAPRGAAAAAAVGVVEDTSGAGFGDGLSGLDSCADQRWVLYLSAKQTTWVLSCWTALWLHCYVLQCLMPCVHALSPLL